MNWGCGYLAGPGLDQLRHQGGPGGRHRLRHPLDGLPLESDSIDYAVSIHALLELRWLEYQAPALMELRWVLVPGGVSAPGAARPATAGPRLPPTATATTSDPYFDATHASGGKLITQMLWYGYSKSLFTGEFVGGAAPAGGLRDRSLRYRQTASPYAEIVELDNRPEESLFVEARK